MRTGANPGSRHRGLVRAVDRRARRHVYAIGERPAGELIGELGALARDPGEDSVPVWLDGEGRVVVAGMPRRPRRSLRAIARWALEPLRWMDNRWDKRARAICRRLVTSLHPLAPTAPRSSGPSGQPAGYLSGPGPLRLPLYGAVHPITGDQLLTTLDSEADRLGYAGCSVLGYLLAEARVTPALGETQPDLSWVALSREQPRAHRAMCVIEGPRSGTTVAREAFVVWGWALWPPESVARVDITIDGVKVGPARLGMPRRDVARSLDREDSADAQICGFEFSVAVGDLPTGVDGVQIGAEMVRCDGARRTVRGPTVSFAPALEPLGDRDVSARELRERVRAAIARSPRTEHDGLNILVFTHDLGYGGAQRHLFELLRRVKAEPGVSCTVAAPFTGPYADDLEDLGIAVHLTAEYSAEDAHRYEGRVLELASWAAPQSFDLAVVNCFDSYLGADVATRLGIPVLWSIHESIDLDAWWVTEHSSGNGHGYARHRARQTLREADALVFPADATRRLYEPYGRPERMLTVPYGMELDAMHRYRERFDAAAARRRFGIAEDATVILTLGTIVPRKCQAVVAQAFAQLAGAHPDAVLALVGQIAGTYGKGLRDFADRSHACDRIHVLPVTADPYAWHGIADVLVLASDLEASPLVILEAMAFGTPVVASSVFGVPELIEDGVNGYLCEPSDVSSLAGALERALGADAPARDAMVAAARESLNARHDPVRHQERMFSLMTDLANSPGTVPRQLADAPRLTRRFRRRRRERVSVLIPTLNAGEGFERSLEALRAQEGLGALEILVVDSGSEDDTVAVARRAGAEVTEIPPAAFNHGGTRDALAAAATGEMLLMTVQDATLSDRAALDTLVGELHDDERLAASSATAVAGEDADLFSLWSTWAYEHAGDRPEGAVDNVCALIRREAWQRLRFRELDFGEDMDFGLRATRAGWTTRFSPEARVVHHHDRPADHALARAAIHHLRIGDLTRKADRHRLAAAGVEQLLAALPEVSGRLQGAFDSTLPGVDAARLAEWLRHFREELVGTPAWTEPAGELALIAAAGGGGGSANGEVEELGDHVRTAVATQWLSRFARTHRQSVERPDAEVFLARLVAIAVGEVLGNAMRDAPDSPVGLRVRAPALTRPTPARS